MTRANLPSGATPENIDPRARQLAEQYSDIDDVPYVADLGKLATLGLSGDRRTNLDAARALLLHAVLLHSPAYLGVAAALPPRRR